MIVFCEECGTRYNVDLDNIEGLWHSFRCRECDYLITISKEKPTEIISPDVALRNQLGAKEITAPIRKKRVLVVDDSKLFRRIIKQILESDGTLEVVGEAADGHEALQRNQELKPDLITLDVNMPGMGGASVLKRFMLTHPCPVVIVSNLSNRSQDTIIDFLRLGAVDFLVKPRHEQDPEEVRKNFVKTVHDASVARVEAFTRLFAPPSVPTQIKPAGHSIPCRQMALIVSGAGGIAELFHIFNRLPRGFDGTVIVIQTMPEELVAPLVAYMNQICRIPVLPIARETPILAGQCYIGTSDTALELRERHAEFFLTTANDNPAASARRQGLDTLLRSVADYFPGMFSLTVLSGAKACSLETLRYFKVKSGKIIVKQPSTCMVRDHVEEIGDAGLSDAEAAPGSIVKAIIEHLRLQCMPLPDDLQKKSVPEFFQKRRLQRIYFTLQTGPRITLGIPGLSDENTILQAGVLDLSEAGIGFVVTGDDCDSTILKKGEKVKIVAVDGEPQLSLLAGVTAEIRWVMDTGAIPFTRYGGLHLEIAEPIRLHLRQLVDTALRAHQSALSDANCYQPEM